MINLRVSDVRPFVPAEDFALSKDFYVSLGWMVEWSDDSLALMENADQRFYLQCHYVKEWAENSMMHITVEDAQADYIQVKELLDSGRFSNARVAEPKREPYGALVTYVWDPAGVLLHLAQWVST